MVRIVEVHVMKQALLMRLVGWRLCELLAVL